MTTQWRDRAAVRPGRDDRGRPGIFIRCKSCGREEHHTFPPEVSPVAVTQRWGRRGWKVVRHGVSATCPECLNKTKAARREPTAEDFDRLRSQANQANNTEESMAKSDKPATGALRRLFTLLEEHYDESLRSYDEGWSDQRVATECGLAERFVAETREDAYGPLLNPAIREISRRLTALEAKSATDIRAIEEMLGTLRAERDAEIKGLREALAAAGVG